MKTKWQCMGCKQVWDSMEALALSKGVLWINGNRVHMHVDDPQHPWLIKPIEEEKMAADLNVQHLVCESVIIRKEGSFTSVKIAATDNGAGIWIDEGTGIGPMIAIYKMYGQMCIGLYKKGSGHVIDCGLSTDEKGGILQMTDYQGNVHQLHIEDLKKALFG